VGSTPIRLCQKNAEWCAISIVCSEKNHFPSLARKKSKGEGTISEFFIGFFQHSLGKIQRSLGKNLDYGPPSKNRQSKGCVGTHEVTYKEKQARQSQKGKEVGHETEQNVFPAESTLVSTK
jgi:hypothetical protein